MNTAIFFIYSLILLAPSIFFSPKGFVRAAYVLLIIFALINSKKIALRLTLPLLFFVPAALYLQTTFKAPMNESFWMIMFNSNTSEALDYLQTVAFWPFAFTILLAVLWGWLHKNVADDPIFKSRWIRYICLSLVIVPIVHLFKGYPGIYREFNHHFAESFPLNVILSYPSAHATYSDFNNIAVNSEVLKKLEASTDESSGVYVLVLGESARRDRLQIYGAKTPNTPEMTKRQEELIIFKDMISLFPQTADSLPVILANDIRGEDQETYSYSMISVFKKAGYATFWISNQASMSSGGKVASYSKEADVRTFFHHHDSSNPYAYDGDVINEFKKQLVVSKNPKKFFVLHLQGSHYSFDKRYPRSFNQFEDSYDNTLLYTDYLINDIIKTLEENSSKSALFYISDHGLLFNACGHKYKHFDNKESYEVPFVFWASKDWKLAYPNHFKDLKNSVNRRMTSEVTFGTVLDAAQIKFNTKKNYTSLLDRYFEKTRMINTFNKKVNYDRGENDSECHISEF